VSDANELCPTGWHIPTDCEWMYLENTLGLTAIEQQATGSRGSNQGGMLKSINSWAAPNTWATNNSGFSGMPSGLIQHSNVSQPFIFNSYDCFFQGFGYSIDLFYHSASPQSSGLNSGNSWWASDGYTRSLTNSSGQIERSTSNGYNYKSIRCLKD
jgi:uncharacterized protein (TIGR02145 family)